MWRKVKFLKSVQKVDQCPDGGLPEVALLGRSNCGKSSMINLMLGQGIAKVSAKPGKTILLNFFEIFETGRLVDTPGYGYAARGHQTVRSWRSMLEGYLSCRSNLAGCLIVMDVRRDWSDDEEGLVQWLDQIGLPSALVLTKTDKLNRKEMDKKIATLGRQNEENLIFYCSTKKPASVQPLKEFLQKNWFDPRAK